MDLGSVWLGGERPVWIRRRGASRSVGARPQKIKMSTARAKRAAKSHQLCREVFSRLILATPGQARRRDARRRAAISFGKQNTTHFATIRCPPKQSILIKIKPNSIQSIKTYE